MYYKPGDPANSAIAGITVADGTTNISTTDITSHLTSGTLGANITLRDTTYPTMQAQLDSFSATLINRFNNAGMPLFTNGTDVDSSGTPQTPTPQSYDPTQTTPNGIVSLSSAISVSNSYATAPSQLAPNGSISAITQVLSTTFGTSSADVDGTLSAPTTGLGPSGTLQTGYSGTQGLVALATSLTSAQGAVIGTAGTNLTYATAVQTTINAKVTNVSGVNVNNEMAKIVALQNAYTANAKIISSVQTMFSALLNAIN
jgi:flagellar hook-associated protein 1 FlgK